MKLYHTMPQQPMYFAFKYCFQKVEVKFNTNLFILEPRNTFGSKNKPVVAAASFHNTQVVDAHVPLADHLIA